MMSKQGVPFNLFRLTKLTETENETINFCRSFGLFPSEIRCPNCNILLEKLYHFKNRNATTFRYQCNRRLCRRKGIKNSVTLHANTWFNEAGISIRKSLFMIYRSGMVNSNMVNSKFHLIRSFFEIFARFLSFHV